MSRDLNLVHPKLRTIVNRVIEECKAVGLAVLITDGWRSKEEQDKIYAQGRTTPGVIVSRASYPYSAHNWGVAVDFCRNVRGHEYEDSDDFFRRVATIAKKYGLEWGGDWKNFVDKPHLQLKEFMPNNSVSWLLNTYGNPENFKASWSNASEEDKEDVSMVERWKTLSDIPEGYYREQAERLVKEGILSGKGDGVLDITEDMLRVILINERMINKTK